MTRPGRVLITTDAVGGVWRYSVDLVNTLDRTGIACLLLGAGPEPDTARAVECARWQRSEIVWTTHALEWMTDEPAAHEAARADLERHARAWRADILHLHLPSQAAGIDPHFTVVATSHSCQATWWNAVGDGPLPDHWQLHAERTRTGLARADRNLVPTRAHAAALCCSYGPIDRVAIVPNAVIGYDGVEKEPFVLAAARWWDAGKNGHTLDQAAARISWPVQMAGPCQGPNGSSIVLEHAAALGDVPHADLRRLMARAAILASPSLYEPFGLAVLEAASHGCALVLADIPTFRELWSGAAIFADPRDPQSFADAIEALACDQEARSDLGRAAKIAADRLTPERQRDAILAVYAECLPVAT